MNWQPIETAPRDGSDVLLFTPGYGWRQGKWSPYYEGDEQPWKFERYGSDGCGCCSRPDDPPTKWAPLPEETP